MPLKNGLVATEELLKINPKLKIIFLSADLTVKDKAMSLGAILFIEKPFTINVLHNSLETIMD
jgi:two-component system chemotaxis response regulator CheY